MSTVFLPIVAKADPLINFGAQIEGRVSGAASWLVPGRIYQLPVYWHGFDSAVLDADVALIEAAGGRLAFGIKGTPPQCRLWPEYVASPPSPTSYADLVEFVRMLVARYSPLYVELFNEPNVARDAAKQFEQVFGSWIIDGEDPELGGRRYGSMLRAVYPELSATGVQVYGGALMYNGLLDGFIKGIGSAPMDALSWHCYIREETPFTALDDRIKRLQSLTDQRLAITETSVLSDTDSAALQERQAGWLRYLIEAYDRLDLTTVCWYTYWWNNGWMNSDLIHNGNPQTPAYVVFRG